MIFATYRSSQPPDPNQRVSNKHCKVSNKPTLNKLEDKIRASFKRSKTCVFLTILILLCYFRKILHKPFMSMSSVLTKLWFSEFSFSGNTFFSILYSEKISPSIWPY